MAASELFRSEMKQDFDGLSDTLAKLVTLNREGADKSRREAQATFDQARTVMLGTITAGLVLVLIAGWAIFTKVTTPLASITNSMQKISDGDLATEVLHTKESNEIGLIARTLLVFRDVLGEAKRLREETEALRVRAEEVRKEAMLKLADDFERSIGVIVSMVSSAATEMQAAATQLTATATETSHQSTAVSAAAEEAGTNVTSVASAAEELGASVGEIGRQVSTSAAISQKAVEEADRAGSVISELNTMADSIGGVVDLIAGLAGQTTRATTEISEKIAQIQAATERAAQTFQGVAETIRTINSTNSAIACAVEQQSAATSEIVKAVAQASLGAQEVTANIIGVAEGTEQTGAAASQVLASSSELAQQSERLHHQMETFLISVRAA